VAKYWSKAKKAFWSGIHVSVQRILSAEQLVHCRQLFVFVYEQPT
jgi:hypothetical protein